MTREELQPGKYYKLSSKYNVTLFQFKSLGRFDFEINIYKGIRILQESIDTGIWANIIVYPTDSIEEINERTFDKAIKQFNISKTAILATLEAENQFEV